jgi:phage baseplate assembly protein gpV
MESIVSIMQQIAAREAEKIYTTELGIVTAIFPHEDEQDKNNYQCSINLKNRKKANGKDFELRKVPLTTGHIGTVIIPNVGDLVVVAFINGDLNAPIIIGRLYNDEQLPPISKKEELVVEGIEVIKVKMKDGKTTIEIDKDGNMTVNAQKKITLKNEKTSLEMDDEGNITMQSDQKMTFKNKKTSIEMDDEGNFTIQANQKITVKNEKVQLEMDETGKLNVKAQGDIAINDTQIVLKPSGDVSINDGQIKIQKGGEVNINSGGKGAAREGDNVLVTVKPNEIIVNNTMMGPSMNQTPLVFSGIIQTASKTVKIGG